MRHLHILLLAYLRLCRARQAGFSIHEDILAYPQFEVSFAQSYILEQDAQLLLSGLDPKQQDPYAGHATSSDVAAPAVQSPGGTTKDNAPSAVSTSPFSPYRGSGDDADAAADGDDGAADDGSAQVAETYEVMSIPPSRYLCAIPVLAPPAAPNQTATDLAKAEEARALSRAATRGTELLGTMEGECLYYISGWWSYRFCYGREIEQFHALSTKMGKPVQDPSSQSYTLGRMGHVEGTGSSDKKKSKQQQQQQQQQQVRPPHKDRDGDAGQTPVADMARYRPDVGDPDADPNQTELQVRGDERYMVQRVGAGTVCDLTGRDRTIEIRYHCSPGGTVDRISWIKEVTTCAYLMEVRTPRLCTEAAFRPPKPARAHPIRCQLILRSDEEAQRWHQQRAIEAEAKAATAQAAADAAAAAAAAAAGAADTPATDAKTDAASVAAAALAAAEAAVAAKGRVGPDADVPNGGGSLVVGGVLVGGRRALGRGVNGEPPLQLHPARAGGGGGGIGGNKAKASEGRVVQVLARAQKAQDGGKVEMLPEAELLKLDLNPTVLEDLCARIRKVANGRAWRLEAAEVPGQTELEIRAVLEPDDEEESGAAQGKAEGNTQAQAPDNKAEPEEGSEETFKKDEL